MKIEFNDILRLVTLVAAIVFFSIGIWMIVNGISAEGAIDIKSAVVSGSLKTGSAGLFIVLLSFILAVFTLTPSMSLRRISKISIDSEKPRFKKALHIFYVLCAGIGLSAVGAILFEGDLRGFFIGGCFGLGFMAFIWMFFMTSLIEKE